MSLLNWVIGTGITNPMGLAIKIEFNLVMFTEVAEGHGSAMSIGSLDSSKCKGTPVRGSNPRHGVISYHEGTGYGLEERDRVGCWPVFIGTAGHRVGNVAMSQILVVM